LSCLSPDTADIKPQSSLLSAIIKYGQDRGGARTKSMDQEELAYARDHLDAQLMKTLQYTHPSSTSR
jgi:predicted membrane-bound mannosyltransferase